MIRRQILLVCLFGLIFQIFFSSTNTLSINDIKPIDSININASNKCESASIDEFPALFFTTEQLRQGGVLIHIALILYSFAAIEIVCDDYFASALEKISYNLNLTPVNQFYLDNVNFGIFRWFIGCSWCDFYGIGNIGFGIFHINCRCFLCEIRYCM